MVNMVWKLCCLAKINHTWFSFTTNQTTFNTQAGSLHHRQRSIWLYSCVKPQSNKGESFRISKTADLFYCFDHCLCPTRSLTGTRFILTEFTAAIGTETHTKHRFVQQFYTTLIRLKQVTKARNGMQNHSSTLERCQTELAWMWEETPS